MDALLTLRIVAALVAAYFIGAIPWALIVGKRFYGIDPRTVGSGNLGATNVFRALGARAGAATLLLDAAKGAVAVVVAWLLVPEATYPVAHGWTGVSAMLAAVMGHSYSPYIGFKGGKGVATSAGALFVLTPLAALLELLIFIAVVSVSRMVSLGSIIIALIYPPLVFWLYPDDLPVQVVVTILAVLVLWRHRSNMVRIVRGEENRISWSRKGSATKGKDVS